MTSYKGQLFNRPFVFLTHRSRILVHSLETHPVCVFKTVLDDHRRPALVLTVIDDHRRPELVLFRHLRLWTSLSTVFGLCSRLLWSSDTGITPIPSHRWQLIPRGL